jgi:hypothetical protein
LRPQLLDLAHTRKAQTPRFGCVLMNKKRRILKVHWVNTGGEFSKQYSYKFRDSLRMINTVTEREMASTPTAPQTISVYGLGFAWDFGDLQFCTDL